jgi:hypothetical protein
MFNVLQYFRVPVENMEIPMLNAILKSPQFWDLIDAKRALLFQTDSLLLHGDITPFLQYDYVGAPWHRENERWSLTHEQMPQGVGNGGLSLRSVAAMRQIAQSYGPSSPVIEQEDFFFSRIIETSMRVGLGQEQFSLSPRDVAYEFAVEVPCLDLEGNVTKPPLQTLPNVPFGLHATWYYFWEKPRLLDLLNLLDMSVCGRVG